MLECVVNVSEGLDPQVIRLLSSAAGADLLGCHVDPHHHRSVLTLVGTDSPRRVATAAVDHIDLGRHRGAHPRLGAIDVVPFVALDGSTPADAALAADEFARWLSDEHGVPCFRYHARSPSLPEVRRNAFHGRGPDTGPGSPHSTAGACAVGDRGALVAFNAWLTSPDPASARRAAARVRAETTERFGHQVVRTLGMSVGGRAQLSMNLIKPEVFGPADAADAAERAAPVARYELVGLVPATVLTAVPPHRWSRLDLGWSCTIEARLAARSRRGAT